MHASQREKEILNAVRLHGSVTTMELAEQLGVSDQTIRRNVKPLVEQGLVEKVHGAIVAPDRLLEPPIQRRMTEQQDEKLRIARKVVEHIQDGSSLMLDSGSTTTFVAQALYDRNDLSVITNSAQIAVTLASKPGNRVYMAGTELRTHDAAAFGADAIDVFRQFDVQYAILSMAAINHERGFMVQQRFEAEVSECLMERADQVFVVADHSKFERRALVEVSCPEKVAKLVTDSAPPTALADALNQWDVETILA